MDFESPLEQVVFLKRYKRFLADVRRADGSELTVHCANSGSMKGCQPPDAKAWIRDAKNPKRKLSHTLEIIEVDGALVMLNTQRPNHIVEEAILAGLIPELQGYSSLKREVRYGSEKSRIDLLLEGDAGRCWVEVKSATMGVGDGLTRFPDAVTTRGAKHLRELQSMVAAGDRGVLVFCAGRDDTRVVEPADGIDPAYGEALRTAMAAGVEVLAWRCAIDPSEGVRLVEAVPFRLPT